MAGLSIEIPAAVDPVSLAEAKNFLRVDDISEDDDLITGLISSATILCETFCRRSFINKGFLETLDSFPYFTDTMLSQMAYPPSYYSLPRYSTTLWNYSQMIKLFRPPLVSVDRITYMDSGTSSFVDMVPQPLPWYPQTVKNIGDQVADSNGNVQTLIGTFPSDSSTKKTGVKPPTPWNAIVGEVTSEVFPATAVWRNDGPLPQGEFGAYIVDTVSEPGRIFPGIAPKGSNGGYWPSVLYIPNAVQIHFTAGYGPDASTVPSNIKTAIMQTVNDCYENREPVKDDPEQLPRHVRQLLWSSRVLDLAPTRG